MDRRGSPCRIPQKNNSRLIAVIHHLMDLTNYTFSVQISYLYLQNPEIYHLRSLLSVPSAGLAQIVAH
jgi:hypothetical protein